MTEAEPVLVAYGEPDDHLRLSVLVAERASLALGDDAPLDAVEVARSPQSAWQERLDAISEILGAMKGRRFRFIDPDALHCGTIPTSERWNDLRFRRERDQMLSLIATSAYAGVEYDFVRVENNPRVTSLLEEAGVVVQSPNNDADMVSLLSVDVRPIAIWLLKGGVFRERELERHIRWFDGYPDASDADRWVISVAYDCLPESRRRAARTLSTVRTTHAVNGTMGPFSWEPAVAPQVPHVSREAVDSLVECGFLRMAPDQRASEMPRIVRQFVYGLADAFGEAEPTHRWLADRTPDSTAAELERHHHAVASGDVERAIETSRFYVNDVRRLAYELSAEHKFYEAAQVYRRILDFDPQDSYAWEYYGYNLARHGGSHTDVLDALKRASTLEPGNPLYAGRLLGYRAELNEDVWAEFQRAFVQYENTSTDAAAYFAVAVFTGYSRGGRDTELAAKIGPWQMRLRQLADERINEFIRKTPQ